MDNYQNDNDEVSESGTASFYQNNKKLIWILVILVGFILISN